MFIYHSLDVILRLLQLFQTILVTIKVKNTFMEKLLLSLTEEDLNNWRIKDLEQLTLCLLFHDVSEASVFERIQKAVNSCKWSNSK